MAEWPSGGPGQGPAVGVLRRGDRAAGGALGVCPRVLERRPRGWRRADLCTLPICVTQRELSGPDSGHQKRQDGVRGAGHTPGRVRNMLNEQSEESGPGPMLCQLPCADPLV